MTMQWTITPLVRKRSTRRLASRRNKIFVGFFTLVFILSMTIQPIVFNSVADHGGPYGDAEITTVTLCHWDASNQPDPAYKSSGNISVNAAYNPNNPSSGHNGHDDDIIPPFHFQDGNSTGSYPGKNWNAINEDIWNGGLCNGDGILPTPTPTPTPTPSPTPTPTITPTVTPTVTPTATPLICSPSTQTVDVDAIATLNASGGDGSYTWTSDGSPISGNLSVFNVSYSTPGAKTVTLTDSTQQTTNCEVIVNAIATPTPTPTNTPTDSPTPTPTVDPTPTPSEEPSPTPTPDPNSISGYKFEDLNDNGEWDEDEMGLNDWVITVNGGTPVTTGAGEWPDGYYEFTDLESGEYFVCEQLQTNWNQTFPNGDSLNGGDYDIYEDCDSDDDSYGKYGYSVEVAGDSVAGLNFGNQEINPDPTPTPTYVLDITTSGEGNGVVTSNDEEITCDSKINKANEGQEEQQPNDCTQTYDEGSEVTLTVTPDEDSGFEGSWSTTSGNGGTCTGTTTPCVVVVNGNITLNAHFSLVPTPTPTPAPTPTPTNSPSGSGGGGGGGGFIPVASPTPTATPQVASATTTSPSPTPEVLGATTELPKTGFGFSDRLLVSLFMSMILTGLLMTATGYRKLPKSVMKFIER